MHCVPAAPGPFERVGKAKPAGERFSARNAFERDLRADDTGIVPQHCYGAIDQGDWLKAVTSGRPSRDEVLLVFACAGRIDEY